MRVRRGRLTHQPAGVTQQAQTLQLVKERVQLLLLPAVHVHQMLHKALELVNGQSVHVFGGHPGLRVHQVLEGEEAVNAQVVVEVGLVEELGQLKLLLRLGESLVEGCEHARLEGDHLFGLVLVRGVLQVAASVGQADEGEVLHQVADVLGFLVEQVLDVLFVLGAGFLVLVGLVGGHEAVC